MSRVVTFLSFILLVAASPVRAGEPHVLVITIDGFAASLLNNPAAPVPTFRQLAAEGVAATQGMHVVNPAVTWPNHTSIVTGVYPARHGCIANGVIVRGEPGRPARVNADADQKDLVAVPTIFDVLHAAGFSTAAINWPCTRGSKTLDDDFSDAPGSVAAMTPRLADELIAGGILPVRSPTAASAPDDRDKPLTQQELAADAFGRLSAPARDQVWTNALCHVIRARKPRFMLWHFLNSDALHHRYGPGTPAGLTGLALADAHLRDVLTALDDAGIRKDTTIFILADHGFETAQKLVLPNVVLRQGGLVKAGPSGILRANAHIISEGGIALLYLTDPATADADRVKAVELLKDQEGVAEILTPDRYAALGFPDPTKNAQMSDLVLVAKDGYAFSNTAIGDESMAATSPTLGTMGHHGFLSTNPKMNAVFIASGRGIKRGATVDTVRNIDVAPTVAKLLGQEMKDVDGKVLTDVLE
jgi:predicted AlkP superfamily pyrophosphatase or phosphodiesterase